MAKAKAQQEKIRFEVRKDSRVMLVTESESCIPGKQQRDNMRSAGYKLYLNGKIYSEDK